MRPSKLGVFRNIPIVRKIARAVLPRSIRGLAWKQDKLPGRFSFTAEEEAIIIERLRPSLDRLRDTYGVDINRWWNL